MLLLNNDTRVDEYFVAEMVRAIERSEKIFSVSSKMIQMYHPELMDDAGDMYSLLGWPSSAAWARISGATKSVQGVFFLCGRRYLQEGYI